MPEFYLVDAPSRLGLRAAGVEHLPHTLRAVGLTTGLHAIDGGQVAPVPFSPQRDPDTQILNGAATARFASSLADAVAPIVARQHFPIVLGAIAAFCSARCWRCGGAAAMGWSMSIGTPTFINPSHIRYRTNVAHRRAASTRSDP